MGDARDRCAAADRHSLGRGPGCRDAGTAAFPALLFDLDDTLVPDMASAFEAMEATACEAERLHGIPRVELRLSVRARARELWLAFQAEHAHPGLGLSSWEALCSSFEGDGPALAAARAWAPGYRAAAWSAALADHGIRDPGLAARLAERFPGERAARCVAYPDVIPALERLAGRARMALVTNGAPDLQHAKLERSGLARFFDAVVISMEVGVLKPDPRIFHAALARLEARPGGTVMVGNSRTNDVAGARAAGIRSVLVTREVPPDPFREPDRGPEPDAAIDSLERLEPVLEGTRWSRPGPR